MCLASSLRPCATAANPRAAASRRASEWGSGAEGSRTLDLVIANDALYQLSYRPIGRMSPRQGEDYIRVERRGEAFGESCATRRADRGGGRLDKPMTAAVARRRTEPHPTVRSGEGSRARRATGGRTFWKPRKLKMGRWEGLRIVPRIRPGWLPDRTRASSG